MLRFVQRIPANPYVICGEVEGKPTNDLENPWRRIRARAGLDDMCVHDLRHTYASDAVMSGLAISILGKILGHTQMQTTMRYAHFAENPCSKRLPRSRRL